MAGAYVVGMVMPQEEDSVSDDIKTLFSNDDDDVVPATMNEQVALLASLETAYHEEVR
jgi:hypothetical protein